MVESGFVLDVQVVRAGQVMRTLQVVRAVRMCCGLARWFCCGRVEVLSTVLRCGAC